MSAEILSPVPFSIEESVQRVRYVQLQRQVLLANPVHRVREAWAARWTANLLD